MSQIKNPPGQGTDLCPWYHPSWLNTWWSWRELNPRPLPCQGSALPLRHSPPLCYPLSTVNAGITSAALPQLLRDEFSSFACRIPPCSGSLIKHTCLLLPFIKWFIAPRVHITLYARLTTLSIAEKMIPCRDQ